MPRIPQLEAARASGAATYFTGIEYVLLASRWARGIRDEVGMFAVVQKNKSRRCDRLGDLVGVAA